jgi:hypothetical protein
MEWQDRGIIIGTRRHGETSLILEVMTEQRGRHLGLVRGGRSRKQQPVLQPGNEVELTWRARLEEHLGTFQVEPVALAAARLMEHPSGIYGIQLLASHLRLLPERDKHAELFRAMEVVIEHLCEPEIAGPLMVRFRVAPAGGTGFRPRSVLLRRHRRAPRADLCVAEERPRGQPHSRRAVEGQAACPAGLSRRRVSDRAGRDGDWRRFRSDRLFPAPSRL